MSLSISMIVRNGGAHLVSALESVRDIADEIVVVDTGSTDDSIETAKSFGAFVAHYEWDDSFSRARNASLALCRGDWVLYLDADEEVPVETAEVIKRLIKGCFDPYISKVRQKDGHEHWSGVRLFPREGAWWHYRVHEQVLYKEGMQMAWHPGLVIQHHGTLGNPEKCAYYLELARRDYEENPKEIHRMKQYAFSLASAGGGPESKCMEHALALLLDVKDTFPKVELGPGMVANIASTSHIYGLICLLLRDLIRKTLAEAHDKGYAGWWSAVEFANLMFAGDKPEEVAGICNWVEKLPWDGIGYENKSRERIAVLKNWAEEELTERGNLNGDIAIEPVSLEC